MTDKRQYWLALVDEAIRVGDNDPKESHFLEDKAMETYIRLKASESELKVWEELWSADLRRWYA